MALFAATSVADLDSDERARAADYLREAEALCRQDHGSLWGISLCGPVLLINPETRAVFTNGADRENRLMNDDGVYVGKLPDDINVANTAADWAGVKWTMIMLPLPQDNHRRAALLGHEMWHRIQERLGLPGSGAANNHLDTRDGRLWLQLEWRALAAALLAVGEQKEQAVADAELFRAYRREIFPKAAGEERAMEMSEGIAEYTGVKLSGSPDLARFVVDRNLKEAPSKQTFVRSFAYPTGPAYGLLLDQSGSADWRKKLHRTDELSALLLEARRIALPAELKKFAEQRAQQYDGAQLALAEDARERKRLEVEKDYRARLVDGPVLTIPLQRMNMQFNPGNLVPLGEHGTVYPNIRIVDVWGVLAVTENGALMSADFTRVTVPALKQDHQPLPEGDGWKLQLADGWSIGTGQRPGDYAVRRDD
ncbi:MAG: hypothetical protein ABR589_08060 [Chthoniobacterales bacterium]